MPMPETITCPRDGERADAVNRIEPLTISYRCSAGHVAAPPLRPDGSFDLAADARLWLGFRHKWAREKCSCDEGRIFPRSVACRRDTGCTCEFIEHEDCLGRGWLPREGAGAFLALVTAMTAMGYCISFDPRDDEAVSVYDLSDEHNPKVGTVWIGDALTAVEDAAVVAGARALGWPL